MKNVLTRRPDLTGVQAIYRSGELIFKDHQANKKEMEINQEHVIDKENNVDNS